MANTTTINPAIAQAAANGGLDTFLNSGLVSIATITGDATIAAPTTDADGVPFYGLKTAVITASAAVAGATFTAYAMFRAFDDSIAWTPMSGTTPQTVAAGDTGGWNTDAGCPERVAVVLTPTGGATFAITIGGHQ